PGSAPAKLATVRGAERTTGSREPSSRTARTRWSLPRLSKTIDASGAGALAWTPGADPVAWPAGALRSPSQAAVRRSARDMPTAVYERIAGGYHPPIGVPTTGRACRFAASPRGGDLHLDRAGTGGRGAERDRPAGGLALVLDLGV